MMRLANSRGAAFLLAVYFASLMLFLLGGVSLQRTMVEVHSAQVSRDMQQAFWAGEASFDKALAALSERELPDFDDLGCAYATITLPNLKPVVVRTQTGSAVSVPHNGSYMICTTDNPEQFQVEMLGLTPEGKPVWLSAFLNRTIPSVTLGQAVVGIDRVTITHGHIAGVDTQDPQHPVTLAGLSLFSGMPNTSLADLFGDLVPLASGVGNNQGHIGTKSRAANAIQLLNRSVVDGDILSGTPEVSGGSVFDAVAANGVTSTLPEFPGVQVPTATAWSLADTLLPSTRSVDAEGNITIANHWAAVTAGTYQVKGLTLSDASLSTIGPVNLFVDGPLTVTRSLMYGQPDLGNEALINTLKLMPANLRIFVAPTGAANQRVLIQRGSVVGGIVYAPEVDVKVTRKSLVLGALVGKSAEIGLRTSDAYAYMEATNGTKVYFDQSVAGVTLHPAPEAPDPETLFYRTHLSVSEASDADTQQAARLERWFEFSGVSPQVLPAVAASSGKDSGGTGYGGGCSCYNFGSC